MPETMKEYVSRMTRRAEYLMARQKPSNVERAYLFMNSARSSLKERELRGETDSNFLEASKLFMATLKELAKKDERFAEMLHAYESQI